MPHQKYHPDRMYLIIGEPGPGTLVVGYLRYSSDLQNVSTLITQKRVITAFAQKKGWTIVRWYVESAHNAKYENIEDRPVFAQLLHDAETGQFQAVLCYSFDRWTRNVALTALSLSRLQQARIWWATADGLFNIDQVQQDESGSALYLQAQWNEAYLRQLSRRTINGKEDRARDSYHSGNVPFGYRSPAYQKAPDGAPSTWRPPRTIALTDPVTFPALVKIGELVASGWTDRAIADELEGYVSKTASFGERL